jgi:hypothetical protein
MNHPGQTAQLGEGYGQALVPPLLGRVDDIRLKLLKESLQPAASNLEARQVHHLHRLCRLRSGGATEPTDLEGPDRQPAQPAKCLRGLATVRAPIVDPLKKEDLRPVLGGPHVERSQERVHDGHLGGHRRGGLHHGNPQPVGPAWPFLRLAGWIPGSSFFPHDICPLIDGFQRWASRPLIQWISQQQAGCIKNGQYVPQAV